MVELRALLQLALDGPTDDALHLSRDFAQRLDDVDPLHDLRNKFFIPKITDLPITAQSVPCTKEDGERAARTVRDVKSGDDDDDDRERTCIYFSGNSLGLMPRSLPALMQQEMDKWSRTATYGRRTGTLPWEYCDELLRRDCGQLIGAFESEVVIMNHLTVNMHLLFATFYRPRHSPGRYKILIEANAFPSDYYAVSSQLKLHGYEPSDALVVVRPRDGEHTLRAEDIEAAIVTNKDVLSLVWLSGIQYYSGQLLPMARITAFVHGFEGISIGWDLAHVIGNVEVQLHDWSVDFACWCSYKYLNASSGAVGGAFVHAKHHGQGTDLFKLQGWWGHEAATRFNMDCIMRESEGANAWRLSTPPIFLMVPLRAALDVFAGLNPNGDGVDPSCMQRLRDKSRCLTSYLEWLLESSSSRHSNGMEIITPRDPDCRGAQLSVRFSHSVDDIFQSMQLRGIFADVRRPDVIRLAPVPSYNTFVDVWECIHALDEILSVKQCLP